MNDNEIEVKAKFEYVLADIAVLDDERLTPLEKITFIQLRRFANFETLKAFPSIKKLAEKTNCSERSVQNALKKLVELGLITREERFLNGRQTTPLYTVIGKDAECYKQNEGCKNFTPPRKICTGEGAKNVPPYNYNHNELDNTLKRESELPNSSEPEKEEQGTNNEVKAENETGTFSNDQDKCPLTEAPEILQPVVCYLFFKTGRNTLHRPEIEALNELAEKHTPKRIKHEIDTSIERFLRKNKHPASLRFEYIASALSHQTSLKPKKRADDDAKIKEAAAEFKAAEAEVKPISDEAWEAMQAEMKEWS